jgi:hypothetical protein
MEPPGYRSYLVRLWREPAVGGGEQWCGEAEHIQSGRTWRFASLEALAALFLAATVAPQAPPGGPRPDRLEQGA